MTAEQHNAAGVQSAVLASNIRASYYQGPYMLAERALRKCDVALLKSCSR